MCQSALEEIRLTGYRIPLSLSHPMSTPTTFSPSNLSQEQLLHLWGTEFQYHCVIRYQFKLSYYFVFMILALLIFLQNIFLSLYSALNVIWVTTIRIFNISVRIEICIRLSAFLHTSCLRSDTSESNFSSHTHLSLICIHPPIPQIPPIHSGARSISRLTKRYTEGSEEASSSSNMSASALANGASSNIRTGAGTKPKVTFFMSDCSRHFRVGPRYSIIRDEGSMPGLKSKVRSRTPT